MTGTSAFVVPVGALLAHPGKALPVQLEAAVDWGVDFSAAVPDHPLSADLVLTSVPGGVVVRGDVEVTMRSACARCLTETDHVQHARVDQLAVSGGSIAPDDEPGYVVDGDQLDLEPMLRDEVLLALPVLWTCPEGCAGGPPGVGESAGTDLNTATPGQRSDSPFAALRDLLDPGR